jgi:hypothetical protein
MPCLVCDEGDAQAGDNPFCLIICVLAVPVVTLSMLRSAYLRCSCRVHENYTSLLHFVLGQSAAAAQVCAHSFGSRPDQPLATKVQFTMHVSCRMLVSTFTFTSPSPSRHPTPVPASVCCLQATAVAFGSNHTAGLLINPNLDGRTGHHSLYTFGRGKPGAVYFCRLQLQGLSCKCHAAHL